jgi:hypothetical protein
MFVNWWGNYNIGNGHISTILSWLNMVPGRLLDAFPQNQKTSPNAHPEPLLLKHYYVLCYPEAVLNVKLDSAVKRRIRRAFLTLASEKPELYKEYPQPNEAEIAQAIISLMEAQMEKNSAPGKTLRDVHSKTHGCIKGYFEISPDVPADFRVGVFSQPRRYSAWMRFSNAGGFAPVGGTVADKVRDVRGLAIKLLDVPGEKLLAGEETATTQDFLLFTAKEFLGARPVDFLDLMKAVTANKLMLMGFLITHPAMTLVLLKSLKIHTNLFDLQYYSSVPYALGNLAVKYTVKPQVPLPMPFPRPATPNYLRERMAQQLAEGEIRFDFLIQVQTDPCTMPIEDGFAVWDENVSPFRKVATLILPKQQFDSPEQMKCCENSSFNPWHCLPEHRPMGAINRTRRIVYQAISEFRHKRNQLQRKEPVGTDPCS